MAEFKRLLSLDPSLSGEIFSPPRFASEFNISYEARNACEFLRDKDLSRFDAIIGHNDFVARGACWALQARGLRPGVDVMLFGEGDYPECRYQTPEIGSVSYDKAEAAERVCAILKRRLKENRAEGEAHLCQSRLIERGDSKWRPK
jgi:DNA-binding LacI/PurR family transcriptional regulator